MHFCEFILIRFVSEFVFITEGTRDYYIEKYKLNKTIKNTIIPSWVEVSDFQITISQEKKQKIMEEFRMKNSSQIIIWYVGTISKMRELDKFVAENNKIILESNYKLIFIGEGDWVNNLNKIIQENGLQENVLILGKKTRDVIPEYIQTFSYWLCHLPDIFVFRNSFPLKILEYLSAGKKVVLSNIDSHRELLGKFKWNLIIYNSQISSALSNENDSFVSSEINTYDWKNLALMYNFIYK
jgi:glycosyltransferase involved in cell wall biosynthesis